MANQLRVTFCILVVSIIANAHPNCNEKIPYNMSTFDENIKTISSGSLETSNNKVFVFTISHNAMNNVTFKFKQDFYITGIGIRQMFTKAEVGNECKSSFYHDHWASYNITYREPQSAHQKILDYPPGVCIGIINPNTLLPFQEIHINKVKKKTFKVALIPTKMQTITIKKIVVEEDDQIYNSGTFCIQFELYGCVELQEQLHHETHILEYEMYEPVMMLNKQKSSDSGYTGICSEETCTGGTGKLTDKETAITTAYDPEMFVIWKLREPVIIFAGKSLSVMKMLFILDDVYFIKEIKIHGVVKIGNLEFAAPSFVTINGFTVDTTDKSTNGGTYIIYLFPFIKTNSIQFQFYFDSEKNTTQQIAFSEISIVTYDSDSESEETNIQNNQMNIPIAIVSPIAIIILIVLLLVSLVLNLFLIITKHKKKKQKTKYISTLSKQTSQSNDYLRTISTSDFQRTETNYESIEFGETAISGDHYKTPTEIIQQEPKAMPEITNRLNSNLFMPPNPTYISTLPLTPIQEIAGYSHLEHTEKDERKRILSLEKSNTLPRLREKSSSQLFTAAERRSSYSGQHELSDLK